MTSSTSAMDIQSEEWTIRYQKLQGNELTKTLLTRAGRLGSLLCDDERVIAQSVFQHTRTEMMNDSIQLQTDQLLNRMAEKVTSLVPVGKNECCPQTSDVDAFFDEYPECIRPGWRDNQCEEHSSTSSDEEEESDHFSKKTKQPLNLPRDGQPLEEESCPQSTRRIPSPSVPLANPYQKRQPLPGLQAPNAALPPSAPQQETISSTWENHAAPSWKNHPSHQQQSATRPPSRRPNTSWEEHTQQQNPFFTAREMAQVMGDGEPLVRGGSNPYSDYQPQQPYDETSSRGPGIPDSLRRKFQPPKRMAEPVNSNSKGKSSVIAPSAKGGVQSINRPSSSSGRSEDEQELPEELQHLDKELVKKIEHEIMESGDTVTFDDIAGLDDAKQTVQEVVCWPMKRPDLFTGLRRAPNGLLLYGPPGTGKTLIGKAIAHESGATFFSISSSSLTSKWIGEGEKLVKTLFAVAAYREPAVVFIDEIDSLLTQRTSTENEASRRIKTEFLVQLDGTGTSGQGRVLVIGATNKPQELDEAARRRFTKRLYIPLPIESDRRVLLNVMLRKNNHELTNQDIDHLARATEGFSGADLKALCTDAAMGPIRQLGPRALEVNVHDVPPITFKHFKRSLKGTKPSVAPSDLVQYEEWDKVYGSKRATEDDDDDDEDMD